MSIEALKEIEAEFAAQEYKAWKPMQLFRTDEEVVCDEARHETWGKAFQIIRDKISDLSN